jgi:hypothetical protein
MVAARIAAVGFLNTTLKRIFATLIKSIPNAIRKGAPVLGCPAVIACSGFNTKRLSCFEAKSALISHENFVFSNAFTGRRIPFAVVLRLTNLGRFRAQAGRVYPFVTSTPAVPRIAVARPRSTSHE